MSVKVSLKENVSTVKGYPKLMINRDHNLIVLFVAKNSGFVVSCLRRKTGRYTESWAEKPFWRWMTNGL